MTEKPINSKGITIRVASENDASQWDNYVDNHPGRTFAHRWAWSAILANSFGIKPYYLVAEEAGQILGIFPATLMQSRIFGRFLISLPWLDYGGPLAADDNIALQLVDAAESFARDKGCRFLEMRSVYHRLPDMAEKTDKRKFHLDLNAGADAVWKSFNAKARNQVRKAEKSGLKVDFGGQNFIDDFYKIFSTNMRDLGTPVWPKSLFQEIFRYLKDDVNIALVRFDSKNIAGGLMIRYGNYLTVPSASAYRQYLKLCPNNILYWEVIKYCMEKGFETFDFGRSSEGSGTYQFKKQWTGTSQDQVWQYRLLEIDSLPELNPSNPKFKLAINIWRRLPLAIANRVGPKIVTKLP